MLYPALLEVIMIEIDGEFFEDPCELKRKERTCVAVGACINTARAMVEALKDKAPELIIQTIKDLGEVQTKMILAQPLWPHFAVGGIVVNPPPIGAIIRNEKWNDEL